MLYSFWLARSSYKCGREEVAIAVSSAADSLGGATRSRSSADPLSFSEFYRLEYSRVVGFAFVLSGDRWRAEDLAQDAFAAAHRDWDRIGCYDNPAAFVRRAVANRSVSVFRRKAAERHALARMRETPREQPTFSAETDQVWAEVRSLPRRQAQTVALVYLYGLSLTEVGEVLGFSTGTAKTHWRRARQRLARRLSVVEGLRDDA